MKQETIMYKELTNYLKSECAIRGWKYHIVRIESNMTVQGIPDIHCTINGHSFWIECKIDRLDLEPLQVSFREQEHLAGGTVFGVVKIKDSLIDRGSWMLFYKDMRIDGTLGVIVSVIFEKWSM